MDDTFVFACSELSVPYVVGAKYVQNPGGIVAADVKKDLRQSKIVVITHGMAEYSWMGCLGTEVFQRLMIARTIQGMPKDVMSWLTHNISGRSPYTHALVQGLIAADLTSKSIIAVVIDHQTGVVWPVLTKREDDEPVIISRSIISPSLEGLDEWMLPYVTGVTLHNGGRLLVNTTTTHPSEYRLAGANLTCTQADPEEDLTMIGALVHHYREDVTVIGDGRQCYLIGGQIHRKYPQVTVLKHRID